MASNFFRRIVQRLAHDLITERLAKSPLFLKAVHKTHTTVTKSAADAQAYAKRLETTLHTDKDLAPRYAELKAIKDKLKQALAQDSGPASPLAKQLNRRR